MPSCCVEITKLTYSVDLFDGKMVRVNFKVKLVAGQFKVKMAGN